MKKGLLLSLVLLVPSVGFGQIESGALLNGLTAKTLHQPGQMNVIIGAESLKIPAQQLTGISKTIASKIQDLVKQATDLKSLGQIFDLDTKSMELNKVLKLLGEKNDVILDPKSKLEDLLSAMQTIHRELTALPIALEKAGVSDDAIIDPFKELRQKYYTTILPRIQNLHTEAQKLSGRQKTERLKRAMVLIYPLGGQILELYGQILLELSKKDRDDAMSIIQSGQERLSEGGTIGGLGAKGAGPSKGRGINFK